MRTTKKKKYAKSNNHPQPHMYRLRIYEYDAWYMHKCLHIDHGQYRSRPAEEGETHSGEKIS